MEKENRLAGEKSPYLLQHRHNPVDWFPWGKEVFEKARAEGKPIFLSIGYSTCHWCHVMERESFENTTVAAFLNEHFVSIKVDREDRPDVDKIYMTAVQAMAGQGGWPLSVFLTGELKPFYGGTYFPPSTVRWVKSSTVYWRRVITSLPSSASLPTKAPTWAFSSSTSIATCLIVAHKHHLEETSSTHSQLVSLRRLQHSLNRQSLTSKSLPKHAATSWKTALLAVLYWRSASKPYCWPNEVGCPPRPHPWLLADTNSLCLDTVPTLVARWSKVLAVASGCARRHRRDRLLPSADY